VAAGGHIVAGDTNGAHLVCETMGLQPVHGAGALVDDADVAKGIVDTAALAGWRGVGAGLLELLLDPARQVVDGDRGVDEEAANLEDVGAQVGRQKANPARSGTRTDLFDDLQLLGLLVGCPRHEAVDADETLDAAQPRGVSLRWYRGP